MSGPSDPHDSAQLALLGFAIFVLVLPCLLAVALFRAIRGEQQ